MYLSLNLILSNLKEYNCEPHIQNDEMNIWTASPLYQGTAMSTHTIYVGPSEVFFSSMSSKVICVNRNNYILIDHDSWEEILEKIVQIIGKYIEWDLQTKEAVASGCSLQEIVDRSLPFIKAPIGVGNSGFLILAFAGREYAPDSFEMMEYLTVGKGLPLDLVSRIYDRYSLSLHSDKVFFISSTDVCLEGFAYNIFFNEMIWGTCLIFIPYDSFTEDKRQIFTIFAEQVAAWRRINPEADRFLQHQRILEDCLDDTNIYSPEEKDVYFKRFGWTPESILRYFIIPGIPKDSFLYYRFRHFLINHYPACLFIYRDSSIHFVLNTQQMDLKRFVSLFTFEFGEALPDTGISASFQGLANIKGCQEQAQIALEIGTANRETARKNSHIHNIEDYYILYYSHILRNSPAVRLMHPAPEILRDYDQKKKSQLWDTLRVFLRNERRHDKTAETLGIHVNTLKNRLEKIKDLTKVNLEDPDVRLHLMFSFLISGINTLY